MSEASGDTPGAGWDPDPEQPQTQRYWDGDAWTDQRAPLPPRKSSEGLEVAGWVCAVLFPLVGIVIGLILESRDNKNGLWIVGLSIGVIVALALLVA
mgnify:FL=1